MGRSSSLGALTVDIVAKVGGFTKGMTQAERQADKSARAIEARMRRLNADLGKAFAVGGVAVAGAAALVVRSTIEAEKVQAQLAAAIKSTGGAAGLTQTQLNSMAGELQKVTTFGDEAINSAQALLLTFTKIGGEVFPDAIEAAANMATALGTDLQSATMQLGKALNDPIKGVTALGRAGVQFSEDQKAMIASLVETGRTADAQRLILGELETQFGGSAAAARDTLGGSLLALQNAFGDLTEGNGDSDGIRGAKEAVESLTATLQSEDTKRGFQSLIGLLAQTLKFGAEAAAMFGDLASKIQGANKAQSDRTRSDLIDRQIQLEKQIKLLETSGAGAALTSLFTAFPGVDLDPFESRAENLKRLKEELADTIERTDQLTISENKLRMAAEQGGSSGSPNGRGRGVMVTLDTGTGGGGGAGASAARAATESLRQQVDQRAEAYDEIQRVYKQELADMQALAEADQRAKEIVNQTLADLAFETKLLGLNALEREKLIALRYAGADAATAEGKAILKGLEDYDQAAKNAEGIEYARDAAKGVLQDLTDGVGSAQDAIDSLFDNLRARALELAADKLLDGLFDGLKGDATSGGGGIAGFLGSLFGGARASGGPVYPGKAYLVGEEGPELIRPMGAGVVSTATQTARLGGGGATVVNNFSMPGRYDLRTQSQVAADAGRSTQRAMSRGTA